MPTLSDLILKFTADTGEAESRIESLSKKTSDYEDNAGKATKSGDGFFGGLLGGAAKLGLAATGVGALVQGVGSLTGIFSDSIGESQAWGAGIGQLDAVLKSTGGQAGVTKDQVTDLANSLSGGAGLSKFADDAILSGENLLLTFTGIGSDVFPQATQTMLDMSAAMGTDLKGSAIQLGKALNDPAKGMTALTRVGVTFTDEQKKQIIAMEKAGDVAGAQKVILSELGREFGGSAKAQAQTFEGTMFSLSEKMNNVKQSIGDALIPVLSKFANVLGSPAVMGAIQGLADLLVGGLTNGITFLGSAFDAAEPVIATVAGVFAGLIANIQGGVDPVTAVGIAVNGLVSNLGAVIPGLSAFLPAIQGIISQIVTTFQERFNAIVGIVQSVVGIIIGFWQQNGASIIATVTGWANQIAPIIQNGLAIVQSIVMTVFGLVTSFLQQHGTEIQNILTMAWQTISTVISGVLSVLQSTIIPMLSGIATFISQHSTEIMAVINAAWTAISAIITGALQVIQGIVNTVMSALKGDWSGAWAGIQQILSGVWTAIGGIVQGAIDAVKATITLVLAAIKSLWDSNWLGIKTSLEGVWNNIKTAVDNAINSVKTTITNVTNGIKTTWDTFWSGVGTTLTNAWTTITTTVTNKVNEIKTFLEGFPGQVLGTVTGIGQSIMDGIVQGLRNAGDGVKTFILGVAQGALDAIKNFFGIHSPSTVMADLGENLMLGMANGIDGEGDTPVTAFDPMLAAVHDKFATLFGSPETEGSILNMLFRKDDQGFFQVLDTQTRTALDFNRIEVWESSMNLLSQSMQTAFDKIKGDALTRAEAIGQAIAQGIANGVRNNAGLIAEAVAAAVGAALNGSTTGGNNGTSGGGNTGWNGGNTGSGVGGGGWKAMGLTGVPAFGGGDHWGNNNVTNVFIDGMQVNDLTNGQTAFLVDLGRRKNTSNRGTPIR